MENACAAVLPGLRAVWRCPGDPTAELEPRGSQLRPFASLGCCRDRDSTEAGALTGRGHHRSLHLGYLKLTWPLQRNPTGCDSRARSSSKKKSGGCRDVVGKGRKAKIEENVGASKAWSFSMGIKGSGAVVGGRCRAHELVRTSCRSRAWQQISKNRFISYKTFAGAGRRGAARAGVLALELVRVCSQAPPFLEACSGDVLGSRPVARRGRGSSETRCSDACCALPSPRSRLPKVKEEAAEAELVVGDKSQVIKVVLRQLEGTGDAHGWGRWRF